MAKGLFCLPRLAPSSQSATHHKQESLDPQDFSNFSPFPYAMLVVSEFWIPLGSLVSLPRL